MTELQKGNQPTRIEGTISNIINTDIFIVHFTVTSIENISQQLELEQEQEQELKDPR